MSNIAVDQLFQITTSTPSGRESLRTPQPKGDPFRAHLSRANDAAEPRSLPEKNVNETSKIEAEETLETTTGEQETSTTEQDHAAAEIESAESTTEASKESPPDEEPSDKIELSTAAVAAQTAIENSELVAAAGQVVSLEKVSGTFSDNQQSSDDPPTEAATQETADTIVDAENLVAILPGDAVVDKAGSDDGLTIDDAEVVTKSLDTTLKTAVPQAAVAGQEQDGAKKSQTSAASKSYNEQQAVAKHDAEGKLPKIETTEKAPQSGAGRFELPATTAAVVNKNAVVELALDDTISLAEPTTSSPNASNASTETVAAFGRAVANQLAGKTATPANAAADTTTTETPTVDRARFVHRVSGAIRSAQQRDGKIQLRLSPPELGVLRIQMVLSEGVLTAHLETETTAARAVLLDNLPMLRERLAEQEIHIEKFDVDVGRENQQQADGSESDDRQPNRSRSQANQSSNSKNPSLATVESSPTQAITASGLDVRI